MKRNKIIASLVLYSLCLSLGGVAFGYFLTLKRNTTDEQLLKAYQEERAISLLNSLETSMMMSEFLYSSDINGIRNMIAGEITDDMVYVKLNSYLKSSKYWPEINAALERGKIVKKNLIDQQEECDKITNETSRAPVGLCHP